MQKSFLRETAGTVMRAVVVVATIFIVFSGIGSVYESETGVSDGVCNVAVFPVEGVILPYHGLGGFEMVTTPDHVASFMDSIEDDGDIDAVLLEINSPGGTPVASERIADRFHNSPLPVVGLVGDMAASGGYMIAAATDYLIASPMSDVGSIGVNMSYVEESLKNEEEGLTYVQLTTGKFKDAGSPNRPITDEEREMFEADLQVIHDQFVGIVSDYRDMEVSEVEKIADGSSMPGLRAIDAGLVDSLGGRSEARRVLSEILNVSEKEVVFCEYESPLLSFY